jgi:hypothetical protein
MRGRRIQVVMPRYRMHLQRGIKMGILGVISIDLTVRVVITLRPDIK